MAEANFNEFVAGRASGQRSGNMVHLIGAATTLALVLGIAVWGYKLAVRDASGVPVIMAIEGPMRVAPEDPGGLVASNTGLAVSQIAASGSAGEVPEHLQLASAPVALTEDDIAGVGSAAPQEVVESDSFARTLALAEELARQAAAEFSGEEVLPEGAALPESETISGPALRPMPRPVRSPAGSEAIAAVAPQGGADRGGDAIAAAITAAVPVSASVELAVEDVPSGARLAQIGAFDQPEQARAEWDRIVARHGALFDGKSRVIQPASSVGRTFYRLRVAGFTTEDESRRFCSAVEAGDLRCTPVTVR